MNSLGGWGKGGEGGRVERSEGSVLIVNSVAMGVAT